MSAKILLDASSLNFQLSGIGYYCYYLYENILKCTPINKFALLFKDRNIADEAVRKLLKSNSVTAIFEDEMRQQIFRKISDSYFFIRADNLIHKLKVSLIPSKYRIYHGQDLFYGKFPKLVNVTTVYDMTTFLFPHFHAVGNIERSRLKLKFMERNTQIAVCISESARNDLIQFSPSMKNRSIVIYPSVAPVFNDHSPKDPKILYQYNIPEKPYLFSVSTIEPRKNFSQVLQLFQNLKTMHIYKDFILVLTGQAGWNSEEFNQLLNSHPNRSDIFLTGYLPQEDLASFYKNAALFVYLSNYEGFGLPVLEAIQSGCPLLAGNNSSIPEVTGDKEKLVNVLDIKEVTDVALELLENPNATKELSERRKNYASKFSWKKSAEDHLKLYAEL